MVRMKCTPLSALRMAEDALSDRAEPFYCQRNAWAYKEWLDMRNAIADRIVLHATT